MAKKSLLFCYGGFLHRPTDWFLPAAVARDLYEVDVHSFSRPIPLDVKVRFRWFHAYRQVFRQAWHILKNRCRYDGFICTEQSVGLLASFLARVLGIPCARILLLNFIFYKKTGWHAVKDWITRYALPRVDAVTVSASGLEEVYRRNLGYEGKIYVLHDPIRLGVWESGRTGNYIFSGGRSLRDWSTLRSTAQRLPEERFVVCASSEDIGARCLKDCENVTLFYDTPYAEFQRLLCGAKFIIAPLSDPRAASGILLIFYAFRARKAVISTRTVATTDYIQEGQNGLLVEPLDIDRWVREIRALSTNAHEIDRLAAAGEASLEQYSIEAYSRRFNMILRDLL